MEDTWYRKGLKFFQCTINSTIHYIKMGWAESPQDSWFFLSKNDSYRLFTSKILDRRTLTC